MKKIFLTVSKNFEHIFKDLLRGYETQNKFLNKEILECHQVVQSLESRVQNLTKKNFEMEAEYYHLKSRYLLLLNHFQPNKGRKICRIFPIRLNFSKFFLELAPNVVAELLHDAKEAVLSPFGTSTNVK